MRTTTTLRLTAQSFKLHLLNCNVLNPSPIINPQPKKSPQKSAAAAALIFPDIPCTEFYTTPEKLDVTLVGELFLGIEG